MSDRSARVEVRVPIGYHPGRGTMLEPGRTVRMDLRRKLPGVCARHGQVAVEFRSSSIGFFSDSEQMGLRRVLGYGSVMNKRSARFAWRDFREVRSRGVVA